MNARGLGKSSLVVFTIALLAACSESDEKSSADGGDSDAASGGETGSGGSSAAGGGKSSGGALAAGGKAAGSGGKAAGSGGKAAGSGGEAASAGGAASDAGEASEECQTYCDCMAANCADKTFDEGCLPECAAQTNWDMECRQNMCNLAPAQPANDHCTHAMGVNECLDQ